MTKTKNNRIEILAPVGGQEQLVAAVRSGTDAVYLGLSAFNARRNAENFDGEALKTVVSYCHARGVSVYVTLNTLVMDEEMSAVEQTLRDIAAAGADAVIVQDLGIAALIRRICPTIRMFASTQMAIHNLDGARMLENLGFSCAVLARELSLDEIRTISQNTSIATEVFIHGALCMCMSGCCTLSSMLGGRSGNRGLCAQPCRLNFQKDGRSYALSLKDLSAIGYFDAFREAGVASVKIEGRMKRPEYVAAAVTACVAARAGETPDMDSLRAVFSRSGFTDGYLTGKRTLDMFGSRTKEDVTAAAPVLKSLTALYRAERQHIPLSMTLDASNVLSLTVSDGEHTVSVSAPDETSIEAVELSVARQRAERSLQKLGGTPFLLGELTLSGEPVSVPVSALNAMRREAIDALLAVRGETHPHPIAKCAKEKTAHAIASHPSLRFRFAKAEQVCCSDLAEQIIVPVFQITKELVERLGSKLVAELPRCAFGSDAERIEKKLAELKQAGLSAVLAENLYGIAIGKRLGLTVHGGFGLNVTNSDALDAYAALGVADMTLSFELPLQKIRRLGGSLARGIVAYGELPLMYFRACPMQGADGCKGCTGSGFLTDRKDVRFPVRCEDKRFSVLYNSVPLYLGGERLEGIVDYTVLYFTGEDRRNCESVIAAYCSGSPLAVPRTRGLYARELL